MLAVASATLSVPAGVVASGTVWAGYKVGKAIR